MNRVKYEDTWLTFYNYKEPLTKVKDGHGFYGALLVSLDGEKVQCHICGKLFRSLGGHIWGKHRILARDYKETYGLAYTSSLVSELTRKRIQEQAGLWWKNLSAAEKKWRTEQVVKNRSLRSDDQPKLTLEDKNKRGTCANQLIDKIKEVKEAVGHTPSLKQFVAFTGTQRYKHLIFETFGSWNAALKIAKLQLHKQNASYSKEELKEYLINFYEKNGRHATVSDANRGLIPSNKWYIRRFGTLRLANQLILDI